MNVHNNNEPWINDEMNWYVYETVYSLLFNIWRDNVNTLGKDIIMNIFVMFNSVVKQKALFKSID